MKNLFNYATKELSQDAFLCWFIANYDDEKIGSFSYEFINFITRYDFKNGDIKELKITQQEHNMDIVVDLWVGDKKEHYAIVIEDKTTSSAHSGQLKKYAKEIGKKETNANNRRKVFYKVGKLSEQDEKELVNGDEGYPENDRWIVFDIEKIHDFFSKINETESEILNQYVEHIKSIYRDYACISNKPMKEWNFINYQTFFEKNIIPAFPNKDIDYHYETWLYQGRLVSLAFYRHSKNDRSNKQVPGKYPLFAYPLVEFVHRTGSNKLVVNTHITFHWLNEKNEEKWSWKYNEYEPNKEEAKEYLKAICESLKTIPDIKVRKMSSLRDQTISVEEIDLDNDTNSIERIIKEKITQYFEVFYQAEK